MAASSPAVPVDLVPVPCKHVRITHVRYFLTPSASDRFYADFPAHPDEVLYRYACPSSMKPTQINVPKGSINQVLCIRGFIALWLYRCVVVSLCRCVVVSLCSCATGVPTTFLLCVQIPGECTISGDVRLTPFYKVEDVIAALQRYVAEIDADLSALPVRGPSSKYEVRMCYCWHDRMHCLRPLEQCMCFCFRLCMWMWMWMWMRAAS